MAKPTEREDVKGMSKGYGVSKKILCIALIGFFAVCSGCAFDLAHVSYVPTVYTPQTGTEFQLKEDTVITGSPCGYDRVLSKNSKWKLVGAIPQGDVYRSRDQVLSVECSNVHEAYLVLAQGSIVGYYLPVERGFVKIDEAIKLSRTQKGGSR